MWNSGVEIDRLHWSNDLDEFGKKTFKYASSTQLYSYKGIFEIIYIILKKTYLWINQV